MFTQILPLSPISLRQNSRLSATLAVPAGFQKSLGLSAISPQNLNDLKNSVATSAAVATLTHERALDQFLREHERRALRMAELGTRQREEAMDLVQDAMLGFVKSYALNEAKAAPRCDWAKLFFTVLDSRLTDWHRRQSVRNRFRVFFSGRSSSDAGNAGNGMDEDYTRNIADTQTAEPDRIAMSAESAPAINNALHILPERQRQAFLLRVWQGFDVAQTAEVMRCSEGSVKTHLSRALERLRTLLEPLI
jgi:RNA polymerase sigma-70 factor (ECF subfamily)